MKKPLLYETGLILLTQALALVTGYRMLNTLVSIDGKMVGLREATIMADTGSGIAFFITAIAISTLLIILLIRYLKKAIFFKGLFAYLIFIGSDTVFGFLLGEPIGIMLAALMVALRFLKPIVAVQNLVLMIALAGVSAQLAMFFNTPTLILVLIAASIYDYIAVFKTKHMVKMFKGMMKQGVVLAMVIPTKGKFTDTVEGSITMKSKKKETMHMFIGSGDIAFPSILAVSVFAEYSLACAMAVMLGSLAGLLFDHIWVAKNKRPMPALPAITFFSLLALGLAKLGGF